MDTAFNYDRFAGHRVLRRAAGPLLDEFEVSTKVGYFPDGHSLDPARLDQAVVESADALGRAPATVLLHNPERDPDGLADACETLAACVRRGLCRAWGIATWDPRPLVNAAAGVKVRPDVVMVRAGISVSEPVMYAAERFTTALGADDVWGMAPFAGNPSDPVWSKVDATVFLQPGQQATPVQARLAAAFALPAVSRVAVGTSCPDHLDELAPAVRLVPSMQVIGEYRELLRARAPGKGDPHAADSG